MKPNSASTTIWEWIGSWRSVWLCVALVIATLVAYGNVGALDFVDYDDFKHVVDNRLAWRMHPTIPIFA